jgi:hypothetical protein
MAAIKKKALSRFGPGISFSMLTQPSLRQPERAVSTTPSLRIDNFVEFQSIFNALKTIKLMQENGRPSIKKDFHGLGRAFASPCWPDQACSNQREQLHWPGPQIPWRMLAFDDGFGEAKGDEWQRMDS